MPRVLLAEGHGPTREFVTRSLLEAGFEVLHAEDPDRACEICGSERPAVVVVASDFAGRTVPELAERLRAVDPRVLLVVADRGHLGKALGPAAMLPAKANAYVADPAGEELVNAVRRLASQGDTGHGPLRSTALVLSRPPTENGEIRTGTVARLLHQVWRSLGEGVLVLEHGGRERRLFFLRGAAVACESDEASESLVGWLAAEGRLREPDRRAAIEGIASGLSPGAALIAAGVIEPGEPLQATLRSHLAAMVVRAVASREGLWRFHSGAEFAPDVHPVDLLPLKVILDGARAGIPSSHFAGALRAVMEAYPVRSGDFQQLLPYCGLSSSDLRLAVALDGKVTAREFLDARPRDFKDALSLVWFLSLVGAVAFQDDPVEPDDWGKSRARKKQPLPSDRAEALRQAALQILPGTYFHALGVDIAADPEEVERAYREVSSRFHPEGFAEWDVGDLEDLLGAVQDKVTAAFRVLTNDEKRRSYLSFLALRFEMTGARRPGIDLDAEVSLKRGERALLSRRITEAVASLKDAAERNPKEPEYAAMLGFASLFDPVLPRSQRAMRAKKNAMRALALAPDHPRALAVLALAEEALGDLTEARRAAVAGLRAHPTNEVLTRVLDRIERGRPGA